MPELVAVGIEEVHRPSPYRPTGRFTEPWRVSYTVLCEMVFRRGPVAQGIEQQPSKLKVAGSNPAGVANRFKGL